MTGCSKSQRKARDNLKKGSTKHALLVSSAYLVLSILFWNNPITNRRNPGSDLSNKFVKNLLGLKRQYSGGDACLCPSRELKSRFEFALKSASNSRANSPSEGGLSPVVLTEDDALAWQRQEDGSIGDAPPSGQRLMVAADAFEALSNLSMKLDENTNSFFVDVHLGYTQDSDLKEEDVPRVVVEEKILDVGVDGKSRMYAMTGNLLSQPFTEIFLHAIQQDFRFAKFPNRNRYVRLSSRKKDELFVIGGSVVMVSSKFTDIEDQLCDCVKSIMSPSNGLIQEYSFQHGLEYNPALKYSCSMMHYSVGEISDSKYHKHSNYCPFLADDCVPESLYSDPPAMSRGDQQVITLVFSDATVDDGIFLEFFDGDGKPLAKLRMVGNLAHIQTHLANSYGEHQVSASCGSGNGTRIVVTMHLSMPFQQSVAEQTTRLQMAINANEKAIWLRSTAREGTTG
jgi:hypothetical protein